MVPFSDPDSKMAGLHTSCPLPNLMLVYPIAGKKGTKLNKKCTELRCHFETQIRKWRSYMPLALPQFYFRVQQKRRVYKIVQNMYKIMAPFSDPNSKMVGLHDSAPPPLKNDSRIQQKGRGTKLLCHFQIQIGKWWVGGMDPRSSMSRLILCNERNLLGCRAKLEVERDTYTV